MAVRAGRAGVLCALLRPSGILFNQFVRSFYSKTDGLPFNARNSAKHPEDYDDTIEQFEDIASSGNARRRVNEHVQMRHREEKQRTEFVKRKIIQAKYFRDEPEVNILAWNAKEQIKYLHSHYPEEWTADKLLDVFPVTRQALTKLLRSKCIAKDRNEIEKHDRRVRDKWQLMLRSDKSMDKKLKNTLAAIIESGRICRITNAAGAKDCPQPPLKTIHDMAEEKPSPRGKFSVLIERHLAAQPSAIIPANLEFASASNSVAPNASPGLYSAAKASTEAGLATANALLRPHSAARASTVAKLVTSNVSSVAGARYSQAAYALPTMRAKAARSSGNAAVAVEPSPTVSHCGVPRTSGSGVPRTSGSGVPRMSGSGASAREAEASISSVLVALLEKFELSHAQKVDEAQAQQLTLSKNRLVRDPDLVEPYTYDTSKGYQTPFGKFSSTQEEIPVPKAMQHRKNSLVRKGNDFYDSDGEYLYSVPW